MKLEGRKLKLYQFLYIKKKICATYHWNPREEQTWSERHFAFSFFFKYLIFLILKICILRVFKWNINNNTGILEILPKYLLKTSLLFYLVWKVCKLLMGEYITSSLVVIFKANRNCTSCTVLNSSGHLMTAWAYKRFV